MVSATSKSKYDMVENPYTHRKSLCSPRKEKKRERKGNPTFPNAFLKAFLLLQVVNKTPSLRRDSDTYYTTVTVEIPSLFLRSSIVAYY